VILARQNLLLGLCVSAFLFAALNWGEVSRPVTCLDCDSAYGLPFTFYRAGGFAHDQRLIWEGIIGDLLLVLGFGLAASWIVELVKRKVAHAKAKRGF
jgi:hypothetical protein